MKRSLWLGVLMAILVSAIAYSSQVDAPSLKEGASRSTPVLQKSPQPSVNRLSPPQAFAPRVDANRLFQHLQALNFERYSNQSRERSRTYLSETLKRLGWQPQVQAFAGGVNLVAQRPGTQPTAGTILMAAHYDTVAGSPGADDNASAIAAVLEIARLLGPQATPRTLQLVFFDQEEQGLQGSFAFTANPQNLKGLLGVINLEMLGYACYTSGCQKYPDGLPVTPPTDRGDFIGIVGDQEHLPLLNAFQVASRSGTLPVVTLPVPFKGLLTPDLLRSDHAPFWAKNIGAVMVGDTANFRNPHYHQPSDTPETLDRSFLTQTTQLVVDTVNLLLNSQESLKTSEIQ